MKLVLATRNHDKVREIRKALEELDLEIVPVTDVDGVPEVEETEPTLEGNARKKAMVVARAADAWALGDDTGLEVDALDGAPGVFSARYAGEGATYDDNVRKLLRALEGVPRERRGACFRTVLALAAPRGEAVLGEGRLVGEILTERVGTGGFGYDPVFLPRGERCTLAEMTLEQKNAVSHRGRALAVARRLIAEKMRACRDSNAGPTA